MNKILKEFAEDKGPEDNSDPASEEISAAAPVRTVTHPSNPEQVQLTKLQEVERRFQTVFEAAPIGIAINNPQGYFVEVNDAFIDMLGYSRQEIGRKTFVDITEHKKAKEALAESEEKYRMLFESSAEGILVAQIEDQKFYYANRTICNMLGYGAEELTRMGVQDIHPKAFQSEALFTKG